MWKLFRFFMIEKHTVYLQLCKTVIEEHTKKVLITLQTKEQGDTSNNLGVSIPVVQAHTN